MNMLSPTDEDWQKPETKETSEEHAGQYTQRVKSYQWCRIDGNIFLCTYWLNSSSSTRERVRVAFAATHVSWHGGPKSRTILMTQMSDISA